MNKKNKVNSKADRYSITVELSLNNEPKVDVSFVSHHSIKPMLYAVQSKASMDRDRMYKNFQETGLFNDPIDLSLIK